MAALSVEVRAKRFPALGKAPARPVLDRVRLEVEAGETVAVIGPSGCGKTTLLNLIAGLDRDFEGSVRRGEGGRIAYVFQEPRLLPWRTLAENLALVLTGEDAADPVATRARVDRALGEVGLEGSAETFASRLSLGMARRAAIARAFVVEPTLLLLDEPFVSLDEANARRLRLLLLGLLERRRTAAVFVTHQLPEAVMLAHRLVFLAGSPARVAAERRVDLTPAQRRDPGAVDALHRRMLAEDRAVAEAAPAPEPTS
jgi:ABC-type nitrate/sulfonate/bicarbonate transport system ATPase subunit